MEMQYVETGEAASELMTRFREFEISYFQRHFWSWTGGLAVVCKTFASRSGSSSSRGRPRGSKNSKAEGPRPGVGPT